MADRATLSPLMRSVRDQHLSAIMQALLRSNLARKQLAATTKIGFGTITRLVNALLENEFIEEVPAQDTGRRAAGRPEVPLRLRDESGKVVIGAQIHAKLLTVDAFTLTGQRLASTEKPHDNASSRSVIRSAVSLTKRVAKEFAPGRVVGVGVSTGGQVDFESGRLISSPQLGWTDIDLRGPFSFGLGCPVVVDSSVRSLAVDRLWWSPHHSETILVIVVAGAISSAMIINGELHRGVGATAGDISHFPVVGAESVPCACGSTACATETLTDPAVHRHALDAGLVAADSTWHAIYDDGKELAALRRTRATRLGETVSHLMDIIDPSTTIIAGRIGTSADIESCRRAATRRHPKRSITHWNVAEHEWGEGAAALALDDFLRRPTAYAAALL